MVHRKPAMKLKRAGYGTLDKAIPHSTSYSTEFRMKMTCLQGMDTMFLWCARETNMPPDAIMPKPPGRVTSFAAPNQKPLSGHGAVPVEFTR